jgi:hypothetical protein
MAANDVNTFVSHSGHVHDGKKGFGASGERSKGQIKTPNRAPAKFPGRTAQRPSGVRLASPLPHPGRNLTVKTKIT